MQDFLQGQPDSHLALAHPLWEKDVPKTKWVVDDRVTMSVP